MSRLGRVHPAALHALFAIASYMTLAILVQAALAGAFLDGEGDALSWHETNGEIIFVLAYVQALVGVVAALTGRPRWPAALTLVVMVAATLQVSMGYEGQLNGHIPLGVLLFGTQVATTSALRREVRRRGTAHGRQAAGQT